MKRLLVPILLVIPLCGLAQVTKVGASYQFRAKFARGQVVNWVMTGRKVSGPGGPMTIGSGFLMRILSVRGGIASVRASSGPVRLNGKQFQPATVVEGELDSRMRPHGALDQAGAFSGMFPERAIAIGGSWTAPMQITTGNLPGNSLATYRLTGFSTVGGTKVAILKTTLTGLLQGGGETMVRVSDGIPQRMTLTLGLTYSKGPGREQPLQLKFEVVRK